MKNPRKTQDKGWLRAMGGKVLVVLRNGVKPWLKINRNRQVDAVASYQRPRQVKMVLRAVNIFLAVILLVACVTWLSFQMLYTSDIFRITAVEVQGNKMATAHQVLEKAGLIRGEGMLDFDIQQISKNIRSLPWVDTVEIERHWPSTVTVVIREHTALALINLAGEEKKHLYYVDANGQIFAPTQSVTDLDFPVLSGRNLSDYLNDMQVIKDSPAGKGLEFLKLAAKNNQILPLQAVSEVQVSDEKGLIVYLVDYPFPIYMGQDKIRERYYLLIRVLAQLYRKDKVREVQEIRMDYAEDKIMVASLGSS